MQLSHVISDLFLTGSGIFAFVAYFARTGIRLATLWGVFLIPVSLAAFFGALRFAGVHESMVEFSQFFQVMASTLGACGLMLGGYGLIAKSELQSWSISVFLAVGLVLWMMATRLEVSSVRNLMPLVAMASIAICGLVALLGNRKSVGIYLVLGVALSGAAVWAVGSLSSEALRIDAYHYLLSGSLICFALAALSYRNLPSHKASSASETLM